LKTVESSRNDTAVGSISRSSRATSVGTGQHEIATRKTVSIVIPAFNAEPWIAETLESVARPKYDVSGLEVLIVDDYSTDRTGDIATAILKSRLPGGRIVRLTPALVPRATSGGSKPRATGFSFGEDLELCLRLVMSGIGLGVPALQNRSTCTGRHREILAAIAKTTSSR
jgi:cellulose synthase/poly-beta-1,6-N-acetylglucosamine synthase-like glycosyltransferase